MGVEMTRAERGEHQVEFLFDPATGRVAGEGPVDHAVLWHHAVVDRVGDEAGELGETLAPPDHLGVRGVRDVAAIVAGQLVLGEPRPVQLGRVRGVAAPVQPVPEARPVVERPVHRQLQDAAPVPPFPVRPVVAHAGRVVLEPVGQQRVERLRRQLPGRRPVAHRVRAPGRRQRGQPVLDLGPLVGLVDPVGAQVAVAMMADLVARLDDRADGLRVPLRGQAGNEERAADLEAREEFQQAGDTADDAEAAVGQCRQPPGVAVADAQPTGLGVDVDRERHGDPGLAGPFVGRVHQ